MTKDESLTLIQKLSSVPTYVDGWGYQSAHWDEICDTFPHRDELVNYLMSLDVPYSIAYKFITDDIDFRDIHGQRTQDEFDYIVIYNRNGQTKIYVWTECLGNMYELSDYRKTWTASKFDTHKKKVDKNVEYNECLQKCFDWVIENE